MAAVAGRVVRVGRAETDRRCRYGPQTIAMRLPLGAPRAYVPAVLDTLEGQTCVGGEIS
jgi:hypothetical protein